MNQFCEDLIKIVSAGVWLAVFPLAVSCMIEDRCSRMMKDEVKTSARVIAAIVIICMVILIAGYTIVALFVIK